MADLHTFSVAAVVIGVVVIVLLRACRLIGDLVFVGVVMGALVGAAGTALAGHLV